MPLVTRTATAGIWKSQEDEPSDKTKGVGWIDLSTDPPNLKVADGSQYTAPAIQLGSEAITLDKAVVL